MEEKIYLFLNYLAVERGLSENTVQAYFYDLWRNNPGATLAYLGGALLALFRRRRQDILMLTLIWGYYFFLCAYDTVFVRNILPVLPALVLLGSDFLVRALVRLAGRIPQHPSWSRRWPLLLAGLLLLIVLRPAQQIRQANAQLATPVSPVQVRVASLADRHVEKAKDLAARLAEAGLRVETDLANEKIGAKVRTWSLAKVPYLALLGDREIEAGTAALRVRGVGDVGALPVAEVVARIERDVKSRSRAPE